LIIKSSEIRCLQRRWKFDGRALGSNVSTMVTDVKGERKRKQSKENKNTNKASRCGGWRRGCFPGVNLDPASFGFKGRGPNAVGGDQQNLSMSRTVFHGTINLEATYFSHEHRLLSAMAPTDQQDSDSVGTLQPAVSPTAQLKYFLDLPVEVRVIIYRLVLHVPGGVFPTASGPTL
jgi:hypothetical protein